MNTEKITTSLALTAVGIILVSVFWRNWILLSMSLIVFEFIKNKIIPIQKEFIMFIFSGSIGLVAESVIMRSGPWYYTNPNLLNFPAWLWFLWGFAGCLGISFYEGLTER